MLTRPRASFPPFPHLMRLPTPICGFTHECAAQDTDRATLNASFGNHCTSDHQMRTTSRLCRLSHILKPSRTQQVRQGHDAVRPSLQRRSRRTHPRQSRSRHSTSLVAACFLREPGSSSERHPNACGCCPSTPVVLGGMESGLNGTTHFLPGARRTRLQMREAALSGRGRRSMRPKRGLHGPSVKDRPRCFLRKKKREIFLATRARALGFRQTHFFTCEILSLMPTLVLRKGKFFRRVRAAELCLQHGGKGTVTQFPFPTGWALDYAPIAPRVFLASLRPVCSMLSFKPLRQALPLKQTKEKAATAIDFSTITQKLRSRELEWAWDDFFQAEQDIGTSA